MPNPREARLFAGARVLITGGLGFLGSNLAVRLVAAGARVTLVDALIPQYGGNLFNVESIRDRARVNIADIRDHHAMNAMVRGQDYIFHLAGQVSHVLGLNDPYPDVEYNIRGTVVLLEAVRHHAPRARLVFTGTRGQYGVVERLPVAENAATHPRGLYEITNLAAEKIIQFYGNSHDLDVVLLRLANVYGPRGQMKNPDYGVVNWFVRQVLDDECLRVFGDGKILRDFVYVEDCVDALLQCATSPEAYGEVLNVGNDQPASFLEVAQTLVRLAGRGRWTFVPFSPERALQEPGDYYSDITKIRRLVGWQPVISLELGLRDTLEYYRIHRDQYWRIEENAEDHRDRNRDAARDSLLVTT